MDGSSKKARMNKPMKIFIVMIVLGVLFLGLKLYCLLIEEVRVLNLIGYGMLCAEIPLFAWLCVEMKK